MPIDRAPMIRKIFMYLQKLDGAEEVCTRRRSEDDERRFTLRTVTNGSTGPSSHVLNVSHGVTIGWMSAYIGHVLFRILLPVFPCYLARLRKRSASRRSFLRPLRTLFIIAYHNIFRMNTVVYTCIHVCTFVWDKVGN